MRIFEGGNVAAAAARAAAEAARRAAEAARQAAEAAAKRAEQQAQQAKQPAKTNPLAADGAKLGGAVGSSRLGLDAKAKPAEGKKDADDTLDATAGDASKVKDAAEAPK